MSISQTMLNATSGLSATARMAEIVSSNVANALTDGYGRRRVDLSAGFVGTGVRVDGVTRLVDARLIADRRNAEAGLGQHQALTASLTRLEAVTGVAGSSDSLSARIAALEQALATTGADPSSQAQLGHVLGRLTDVAGGLNRAEATVRQLRQEADAQIGADVATLNGMLQRLERINGDVGRFAASRTDVSGLLDERQLLVDRIATMVPVREVDRGHGTIALMTTGGQFLLDGNAITVGFRSSPVIAADMTVTPGSLSGLSVNGRPLQPGNGGAAWAGGALAAAFDLRDRQLPAQQAQLDDLARDLIARFENPAHDPTLAPGDAGLFTDGGGPYDPLGAPGLAGRIAVNAAVDPARGGALWRLRDGVAATTPGPVGAATQIDAWLAALSAPASLSSGGPQMGAAGLAAEVEGSIGTARRTAERDASYATARLSGLREAELAGGVDTDQEMQMLLRIEQAYAANARVIQAADEMMRRILEI